MGKDKVKLIFKLCNFEEKMVEKVPRENCIWKNDGEILKIN